MGFAAKPGAGVVESRQDDLEKPGANPLVLPRPYLLFLGAERDPSFAKTAFGLKDWAPADCVGEYAYGDSTLGLGLPSLTPQQASRRGARSMVIGVANAGGIILDEWIPHLLAAIEAGLHIVSGMHARLGDVPQLRDAAQLHGVELIDIRSPPANIPIGSGRKRSGKRLLTIGTDCALGKKYTALAVARALKARGLDVDFRATGQTGILIAGGGMPMDAVVSDFESGAAEMLTPDAAPGHWDVIEGQGSILHPAFAAVSVGLLYGSQPDIVIVCHDPDRDHLLGYPHLPVPRIEEVIEAALLLGRRVNPDIRCAGISLNTGSHDGSEAERLMKSTAERFDLPVADPIRAGERFEALVDNCLA
ncbi:DUF1611 domain-containing protein [Sphingosinicella sp. CPCC 101087]|uniref:DUF1611 domain-containing protein n=1 Tax=Sphingosinicella sp. CPCC 101087 TaxID=2497754 RepID=UPI00101C7E40|nr:DUF1611 domain-containing protein [Sphingosinicella sp. CPCC 101087]